MKWRRAELKSRGANYTVGAHSSWLRVERYLSRRALSKTTQRFFLNSLFSVFLCLLFLSLFFLLFLSFSLAFFFLPLVRYFYCLIFCATSLFVIFFFKSFTKVNPPSSNWDWRRRRFTRLFQLEGAVLKSHGPHWSLEILFMRTHSKYYLLLTLYFCYFIK